MVGSGRSLIRKGSAAKLPIMPKLTECAKYALCQFFVTAVDTSEEDYFATGVSIARRDIQKHLLSGGEPAVAELVEASRGGISTG